jgi:hypothetical protein
MSDWPRMLVIMGSGETTPTMARIHRTVVDRFGLGTLPAALIDTPYGFQENAPDISDRAVEYFRDAVGISIGVASLRSRGLPPLDHDTAISRIRTARFVFSGPGSPSYALSVWAGPAVPSLLAEKLTSGGAVTFASAASLTLGRLTVPVYEIYKVGCPPTWLDGLDLLGPLGIQAAVIPHYDNAEGGTHDTRFCYLGERRLAILERELPDDVFILGVDGHTALVLDLGARTATVAGVGAVTVRRAGHGIRFPSGSCVPIDDLVSASRTAESAPIVDPGSIALAPRAVAAPFHDEVAAVERSFDSAVAARDVPAAVAAILEMDRELVVWSRDTEESGEMDHARAVHRSMIVRLGELAVGGARDPRTVVAPFVEALLEGRAAARAARDWAASDRIRDALLAAGVELRDTPEATEWLFRGIAPAAADAGRAGGSADRG